MEIATSTVFTHIHTEDLSGHEIDEEITIEKWQPKVGLTVFDILFTIEN